jgi:hypothetical protein
MPADKPGIGTGRRRQGDTEPDRGDDRNRSLDRALDESRSADAGYERGKQSGASGVDRPHEPLKPGTRRDLEEAGLSPDRQD